MRYLAPFLLVPVLLGLAALRPAAGSGSAADGTASAQVDRYAVVREAQPLVPKWRGRLVPSEAAEVVPRMEAYSGELRLTAVVATGTFVEAGDAVAQLATGGIEEVLEQARSAFAQVATELGAAGARTEREAAASERRLAAAHGRAARTAAALEAWRSTGKVLDERAAELAARRRSDGLEDKRQELDALEARYRDEAPIAGADAYELVRVRRDLARAQAEDALETEAREHEVAVALPAQEAELEEQAAAAAERLATLEALSPGETAAREAALEELGRRQQRMAEQLAALERDLANCELRAPRAGVVLHGAIELEQRSQSRPRLRVGELVEAHAALLCLATPDRYAVAVPIPQSAGGLTLTGSAVQLQLVGEETTLAGTLSISGLPSNLDGDVRFDGRVAVEGALPGRVPGMAVDVSLEPQGEPGSDGFLVPRAALVRGEDGWSVHQALEEEGVHRLVPVTLIGERGVDVVVRGELAAGDRVLLGQASGSL